MEKKIAESVLSLLKDAGKKITGPKKRAFLAKTTKELFASSARKAESYVGWNRHTTRMGLEENKSGIIHNDNYSARGNRKTEEKHPLLKEDILSLIDKESQADPQLKSPFACPFR